MQSSKIRRGENSAVAARPAGRRGKSSAVANDEVAPVVKLRPADPLAALASGSPRVIAQTRQLQSAFGHVLQRREPEKDPLERQDAGIAQNRPAGSSLRPAGTSGEGGAVRQRRSTGVIQRLGPDVAASTPGLVAEYNVLLTSAAFQKLNVTVTTAQNIILLDSSGLPGQPVDYDSGTHTIRAPLNDALMAPRPVADVRDDILWEMHNASVRGALGRNARRFPAALGPNPSRRETREFEYKVAAYALATEWDEWANVAEHDLKTQKINADPAMALAHGAGPHVTRTFAGHFGIPDAGWFRFANYLNDQIAAGHTTAYDANANTPNWAGKRILAVADPSKPVFRITPLQVTNYLSGKTQKVKSFGSNPFKSDAILTQAQRGL